MIALAEVQRVEGIGDEGSWMPSHPPSGCRSRTTISRSRSGSSPRLLLTCVFDRMCQHGNVAKSPHVGIERSASKDAETVLSDPVFP